MPQKNIPHHKQWYEQLPVAPTFTAEEAGISATQGTPIQPTNSLVAAQAPNTLPYLGPGVLALEEVVRTSTTLTTMKEQPPFLQEKRTGTPKQNGLKICRLHYD
jgi:hypothetical protein